MVMDATQSTPPSPQSVGREFVRQYYTLLNKAPNHLHRFYNHQSSFIHGEPTLVIGQKDIYTRIQQLNFHDCHAKISQVDAQMTLGNGVVIQVTGELSNDGQPMRRFTQTFVLAAQAPKKYYVHNDIFRYQDMYTDDDNDVDSSRSEHDVEDMDNQLGVNDNQSGGILVEQPAQPPPTQQQQQQQQPLLPQQQQQLGAPVAAPAAGSVVMPQQAGVVPQQQQPIYYTLPSAVAGGRAPPMQVVSATAPGQVAPMAVSGAPQYGAANTAAVVVPPQVGGMNSHQLNGVSVAGPHDEMLQQQQQQPQSAANIVSGGPVGQNPTMPIASGVAAMPQNNAAQLSAYQPNQQAAVLPQQQQPPLVQQQQTHVANNNVHTPQITAQQQHVSTSTGNDLTENVSSPYGGNVGPAAVEPIIVDDFKTINDQQQQEKYEAVKQQQHQMQNEPKTYANLFKTTTSSPSGFVNAAMQQQQQYQQQQQQQQQQHHQQQQQNSNNSNNSYQGQSSNNSSGATTPSAYNSNGSSNNNSRYNDRTNDNGRMDNNILPQRQRMTKDFDQRRSSSSFSDNHQLFLGNIPHHASEEELKKMFVKFGNVLEFRILSKPSGKMIPGVRNPLNYGFITYEDPESVQNCLAHCPLYFPENSPDRQKLNVEEKKTRMQPRQAGNGGIGVGMGNNNINNNMNNNQRNMSGSGGNSGPQSRSLSGGGGNGAGTGPLTGVMRANNNNGGGSNLGGGSNNNGNNNMSRGSNSGGRMGGGGYRSGASNGNSISSTGVSGGGGGGGAQIRSNNNNNSSNNSQQSGGSNYANRR